MQLPVIDRESPISIVGVTALNNVQDHHSLAGKTNQVGRQPGARD